MVEKEREMIERLESKVISSGFLITAFISLYTAIICLSLLNSSFTYLGILLGFVGSVIFIYKSNEVLGREKNE